MQSWRGLSFSIELTEILIYPISNYPELTVNKSALLSESPPRQVFRGLVVIGRACMSADHNVSGSSLPTTDEVLQAEKCLLVAHVCRVLLNFICQSHMYLEMITDSFT